MKKLLCIILTAIFVVLSGGCSTNSQPERWLNKKASAEDVLSMALEAKLLLEEWDSPKELSPDCFFQYYEALVVYGYVSEQEGESEIDRNIVENVLRLFFDVEPERMRSETYYNKDNKTYTVEGLGNVLDYQMEQVKELNGEIQITYNLYYSEQFKQSGTLTIQKEDESHYHFVSHKIHQVEDVVHPANQESTSQKTASPLITDEELCERALYLLDPYVLPVAWWTGGDPVVLDTLYSLETAPSNYIICQRFSNLEEMRLCTTQIVTQTYAEKYLYPQLKKDAFLSAKQGINDSFLWNSSSPCSIPFSYPISAEVTERKGDTARLMVSFQNGEEHPVEMKLEDGIWKLNSTPYLGEELSPAIEDYRENISETQISDEGLVQRLFATYRGQDMPALWWLDPAGDQLLGIPFAKEHPTIEVNGILYDEASRFRNLEELTRVTKQVFSNDYVDHMLKPWAEEHQHFIEQDGKLYSCQDSHMGFAPFIPEDVTVIRRDETTAILLVIPGEPFDKSDAAEMKMILENGVWKLEDLFQTRGW